MGVTAEGGVASRATASGDPARLGYQPALDGLRAVAVGSVLLYHGGVSWSSGGFLGVDVFFVLSGFLITSLLVTEWQATGGIAIVTFYGRRVRRLFPALLLVLAAVIVYAATLAPASQLRELRGDVLATLGYATNWRLVLAHRGYFDAFTLPSPLKHAWSLAVEEQWYLIWPMVVVGVLRIARRARAGLHAALVLTAVLCVASTIWMVHLYTPGGDPSRVYYGTDTRAQELLAGALLAFLCAIAGRFTVTNTWRTPVRVGGALALAWAVYLFADVSERTTWLYEGGLLVFSFAIVLVILAAIQPNGIVRTVLGVGWLRWIGTISYGLYLWHWPIYIVCTPTRMGIGGTPLLLIRLALTAAVATASYSLVERPIRQRHFSPRVFLVSVPTVVVGAVVATLIVTSGAPRDPSPVLATATRATSSRPASPNPAYGAATSKPFDARLLSIYTPGHPPVAAAGATRLALTGDSVALTLSSGFRQPRARPREVFWDRSLIGCALFTGDRVANGAHDEDPPQCAAWRADRLRWVKQFRPAVVAVLSGVWEVYDRQVGGQRFDFGTPLFDRWFVANMDALIAELSSSGAKVAILTSPCFNRTDTVSGPEPPENDGSRIDHLNRLYREAAARHPGTASVIDLHGYLCPGGKYLATRHGVALRMDDGVHLSGWGAIFACGWLQPKLEQLAAARRPRVPDRQVPTIGASGAAVGAR